MKYSILSSSLTSPVGQMQRLQYRNSRSCKIVGLTMERSWVPELLHGTELVFFINSHQNVIECKINSYCIQSQFVGVSFHINQLTLTITLGGQLQSLMTPLCSVFCIPNYSQFSVILLIHYFEKKPSIFTTVVPLYLFPFILILSYLLLELVHFILSYSLLQISGQIKLYSLLP